MTPLLPAQAFGMMSPTMAPSFVVMVGGIRIRNVESARMAAIIASQPSFSTYLYVIDKTTMSASTLNVPPATALSGAVQSLPNSALMKSP